MLKALVIVIKCLWVLSVVLAATTFGALHGWEHHGWAAAIALGFVGFVVGAIIAWSPSLLLEILA